MEILYLHNLATICKQPRKENLYQYSKIAYYKYNKVYYGYIYHSVSLYTKKYIKVHVPWLEKSVIPCSIITETNLGQQVIRY